MNRKLKMAAAASFATACVAALAQTAAPAIAPNGLKPEVETHTQSYTPTPPADDALYQALGAQPGLTKLVDDFMVRLLADPRMNQFFKDVDEKDLKAKLVTQFCEVSGGPCRLKNHDMKKKHEEQKITKTDFNALVEVLQQSMDAQGIAFATQNRLLAQLAPMHRDVINVH